MIIGKVNMAIVKCVNEIEHVLIQMSLVNMLLWGLSYKAKNNFTFLKSERVIK